MAQTLLQKAVAHKPKLAHPITDQEVEVALAWMRDELTVAQVCVAFYGKDAISTRGGNALYRLAICLREAYRGGLLKVKTS